MANNDTDATARNLGQVSDCGGWLDVTDASLSPKSDVDWYVFNVTDGLGCSIIPEVKFTSNDSEYTACAYFECVDGTEEDEYTCDAAGTTKASDGPADAPRGCCGTGDIAIDHGCTGGTDDTARIHVKVFSDDNTTCGTYSMTMGDE